MMYLLVLLLFNETANNDTTTGETQAPSIVIYQRAHDLLSANNFYHPIDPGHSEDDVLNEFFSNVIAYLNALEDDIVDIDSTNRQKIHDYTFHLAGIWLDAIPLIQPRVQGNPQLELRFAQATVTFFNVGSNLLLRAGSDWHAYELESFLTEIWEGTSFEPQAYYAVINVLIDANEYDLAVQVGVDFLNNHEALAYRGETRHRFLGLYDWVINAAALGGKSQKATLLRDKKETLQKQTRHIVQRVSPETIRQDNEILVANHKRLLVERVSN